MWHTSNLSEAWSLQISISSLRFVLHICFQSPWCTFGRLDRPNLYNHKSIQTGKVTCIGYPYLIQLPGTQFQLLGSLTQVDYDRFCLNWVSIVIPVQSLNSSYQLTLHKLPLGFSSLKCIEPFWLTLHASFSLHQSTLLPSFLYLRCINPVSSIPISSFSLTCIFY